MKRQEHNSCPELINSSTFQLQGLDTANGQTDPQLQQGDRSVILFSVAAVAVRVLLGPVPLVLAHLLYPVLGSAGSTTKRTSLGYHFLFSLSR